jgi:hypothetical protein
MASSYQDDMVTLAIEGYNMGSSRCIETEEHLQVFAMIIPQSRTRRRFSVIPFANSGILYALFPGCPAVLMPDSA